MRLNVRSLLPQRWRTKFCYWPNSLARYMAECARLRKRTGYINTNKNRLMNKSTNQWCDNSVSPVMGCGGCELWPTTNAVRATIQTILNDKIQGLDVSDLHRIVLTHVPNDRRPSDVLKHLPMTLAAILAECQQPNNSALTDELDTAVRSLFRCSAGCFTLNRAGKVKGFPQCFDVPTLFPGRMDKAAAARDLTGRIRPDKSWLNYLPRVISIGELGESLSPGISFDSLQAEVIAPVTSTKGQRHIWLWPTKYPKRMVEFSEWLWHYGVNWPDNLVPIASVTDQSSVHRVQDLARMDVPLKGVSVAPLWDAVELPLSGIDWVIVGGEIGPRARPLHLRWARDLQQQCQTRGAALFLSELGQYLRGESSTFKLRDEHGADWREWPIDLQVRQFPAAFKRRLMPAASAAIVPATASYSPPRGAGDVQPRSVSPEGRGARKHDGRAPGEVLPAFILRRTPTGSEPVSISEPQGDQAQPAIPALPLRGRASDIGGGEVAYSC